MKTSLILALTLIVATSCSGTQVAADDSAPGTSNKSGSRVVLASEVDWQHLNPARGDKAPQAATLCGDRNGTGPTGFLLKPSDGFQSPPHIHNVSYRGVVIRGLIHNDDPNADQMWIPAGSFWTQPKGAVHITAAKGTDTLAYIEIEEGPYLVRPVEQAFQSGEVPINVDASNLVWLDHPGVQDLADRPKEAFLWGKPQDGQTNGRLVRLPAQFKGEISTCGSTLRSVVIQGQLSHQLADEAESKLLDPGSLFMSNGGTSHLISCKSQEECILYVRVEGQLELTQTQHGN